MALTGSPADVNGRQISEPTIPVAPTTRFIGSSSDCEGLRYRTTSSVSIPTFKAVRWKSKVEK
jgi:hypothetical protein